MAQSPFLWNSQGKKMSPEEVARQRAVAALLSQEAIDTSPVGHWSQGAARLVNAFSGVRKERQASAAEEQGRSGAKSVIDALLGGGMPAQSVSMSSSGAPASPGSMPVVDGGVGFAGQTPSAPVGDIAQRLRMGMIERGLPEHVADGFLMNFQDESGLNPGINEQNPTVPGSRGGFGLYQLTGPRRVAYEQFAQQRGVSPADPDAQLDFLMTELQGPESRAAQSIMAAPDAGTAAAAIARDFLRPAPEHLQRRVAQYTGGQGLSASSMGGGAQQGTSPVMQALLQASTDPWVAQEYGPVLQALMGQEQSRQQFAMEQADPMRQLEMQKAQLEIEQMRNPDAPKPIEVGGVLLDPVTYQPIFDSRQADGAKAPETKTVKMQDGSDVLVQWNPATQVWDAAPIPQGGTGGAAPGKLTESQAKTTLFQNLQTETQPVLLDLEKQFDPANMADKAAANLPIVGNYFTSPEYQLYKSNATAWAEGALRISTGAAATEPEIQRNLETYFAQPGDTPMTVAYKAQMREMYNRSIQRSLGRDPGDEKLPLPSEFAAQFAAQQPPPKMGGALPTPPGLEPPAPAPEPQRQGATPFRSRGLSPAPPESAPIEDISALPTVQSPDEARRLPSGTRFRDPQGNIRMVP